MLVKEIKKDTWGVHFALKQKKISTYSTSGYTVVTANSGKSVRNCVLKHFI